LLVVDDNELIRREICAFLSLHPGLEVVAEATDGVEAIRVAETYQPDVVLLDISLPRLNGFQAAPFIKQVAPKAELLFVTLHDNPFFVREAFAAGALGFITKTDVPSQLAPAVEAVHRKAKFVSKHLAYILLDKPIAPPGRPRGIA
jgi:DNA-binding NarL/FixJ family response regulator